VKTATYHTTLLTYLSHKFVTDKNVLRLEVAVYDWWM